METKMALQSVYFFNKNISVWVSDVWLVLALWIVLTHKVSWETRQALIFNPLRGPWNLKNVNTGTWSFERTPDMQTIVIDS